MRRPANIQTERLVLIVLLPEELDALIAHDLEGAARLIGAIFPPEGPQLGDLSWHLKALLADRSHLSWRIRAIVEQSSNRVVGSVNLKGPPNADGDVEIGWGLIESVRGKGYATEASSAVIQWVVQQPGVKSISATVPDDNHASQRVATKLGLTRSSEMRRDLPLWKVIANSVLNPDDR